MALTTGLALTLSYLNGMYLKYHLYLTFLRLHAKDKELLVGVVNITFIVTSRSSVEQYTLIALTLPSKPRFEFTALAVNISMNERRTTCEWFTVSDSHLTLWLILHFFFLMPYNHHA